MRHRKGFNHLSRKSAHRKAMLANMACSLIQHKRINTTLAKAKALRMYVEPLITKSKTDSTHSRRMVFRYLQNKQTVTELFREVAPAVADRQGGYTRILKTGTRQGDGAEMCFIELVDFNDIYTQSKEEAKKTKTRRRRKGGKKKAAEQAVVAKTTQEDEVVEEVEDATDSEPQENVEEQSEDSSDVEAKTSQDEPGEDEPTEAEEEVKAEAEESSAQKEESQQDQEVVGEQEKSTDTAEETGDKKNDTEDGEDKKKDK